MTRNFLIMTLLLCLLPAWSQAQCRSSRIDTLSATLAEDLVASLQIRLDRSVPIMTAPFANLHELKQTSPLGRLLAEEIGSTFSQHGYRVVDHRAFMPTPYTRKDHGETALSLDPDQLDTTPGAQAILTGTYALADGGLHVSARLVNTQDHSILASASCQLRLTEEVHRLLSPSAATAKTMTQPALLLNLKNRADAKRVQQALAAQGLNPGKIDGLWGKKSKAALARFRASLALPATSQWDLPTQNALLPAS